MRNTQIYVDGRTWPLRSGSLTKRQRRMSEMKILGVDYPSLEYDPVDFYWFMIPDFNLPECILQDTSRLFVNLSYHIPENQQILEYPEFLPKEFYLDKSLENLSGDLVCDFMRGMEVPFEKFNDKWQENYARFYSLINPESWKATDDIVSGNNLLTLISKISYTIEQFGRQ